MVDRYALHLVGAGTKVAEALPGVIVEVAA
jgi:hypothetical protein